MQTEDDGVRAVRDVRRRISAEFDDDPDKLVQHYIAAQERHRDRLVKGPSQAHTDNADPASVTDQATS